MGAEKLTQYFKQNNRSGEHAANDLTGDKRVLIRRYADVHRQRFQIGPSQVKPATAAQGEVLETDLFVSPTEAKRLVDAGVAMFVKDLHGNPVTEE